MKVSVLLGWWLERLYHGWLGVRADPDKYGLGVFLVGDYLLRFVLDSYSPVFRVNDV